MTSVGLRCARAVAAALLTVAVSSCAGGDATLCDDQVSIAGYVVGFQQGLGNLESDQYLGLRVQTEDALAFLGRLTGEGDSGTVGEGAVEVAAAATVLADKISRFASAMERADWDLDTALPDATTSAIVADIGSPSTLEEANVVESHVISACGLPPIVPTDDEVVRTLPAPSVPSPTATDPPTNTVNEESEARALGQTIGTVFGLTLSDADTVCLGRALAGVYDATGRSSSQEQYQRQFQDAFDRCGVDFTVPAD